MDFVLQKQSTILTKYLISWSKFAIITDYNDNILDKLFPLESFIIHETSVQFRKVSKCCFHISKTNADLSSDRKFLQI